MIKDALKDSLIYAIAAIIYRGLVLIQVPLFADVLTPYDFGVVDLTEVIVNLLNVTVALEIAQALAIYFSEATDKASKIRIASTSFWFTAICYFTVTFALLPLNSSIGSLIFDREKGGAIFTALLIYAFSNGIFLLSQNLLRWMLRADLFLWTSMVHGLVNLMTSLTLVRHFELGALGLIYSQITAGVVGAGISIFISRDYYKFEMHLPTLKKMLHFSTPLVLSSIAVLSSLFVDRFCLREILGLSAVGIYGVAYRFAILVGIVIVGFSRAFTPLIYNHHDKPETPSQISLALNIYLLASGLIVIFLALFSDLLVENLASSIFLEAANLIPLIALSLILGNLYVFAPGFVTSKKTSYIAYISIICALINFALNLVLIPIMGIPGAAYATLVSSLLAAGLWLGLGQRYYRVPFETKKTGVFGISLIVCLGIAMTSQGLYWPYKMVYLFLMTVCLYVPFRSLFDSMSNSIAKRID